MSLKSFLTPCCVLLFLLCQVVFAETYSERPDILKLTPITHTELGSDWQKLKKAHLEATAMLAEMYPDPNQEIYFLARDSEYLYDMMKIMAQDEPSLLKRIHLLNVSRTNMTSEHIKDYLIQEGITEKAMKSGKKIIFVDTGFSGTISSVISGYYPLELLPQMKTHLMSSSNPTHPSSRVFLTELNNEAPELSTSSMHETILSYEAMPRYTERSTHFEKKKGKWEAVSKVGERSDGKVSRPEAKKYMEDLYQYSKNSKELFRQRREKWKKLYRLNQEEKTTVLTEELKTLVASKEALDHAMVRDFIELQRTNLNSKTKIELNDVGLKAITNSIYESNKLALIEKHPEWKELLQDPIFQIAKLIDAGDFKTLDSMIDVVKDQEITSILCSLLGEKGNLPGVKDFIHSLILKKDPYLMETLVIKTFSKPQAAEMTDLIRMLIDTEDKHIMIILAQNVFSQPNITHKNDLLKLMIQKGDKEVLGNIAMFCLSNDLTKTNHDLAKMRDVIELLIDTKYEGVYRQLGIHVFSKKSTVGMKDLLKKVIENCDNNTLRSIAHETFSQPHTAGMDDLLKMVIEKGDNRVLIELAQYVFSKPHAAGKKDLIKLLIEKGDHDVLLNLAKCVFSRPETTKMKDLLRLVIEKGDRNILNTVEWYVFSKQEFTKNSYYDILKEAVKIHDQKQRIEFLNKQLGPLKIDLKHSPLKSLCDSARSVLNNALIKVRLVNPR